MTKVVEQIDRLVGITVLRRVCIDRVARERRGKCEGECNERAREGRHSEVLEGSTT